MVKKPKSFFRKTWKPGRRGSGYKKLSFTNRWFDFHIIHYPVNSYLDWHTDPVEGKEHRRLNIVLWNATDGGWFFWQGGIDLNIGNERIIKFRPDIVPHTISKIRKGNRVVLSIGWVK